MNGRTNLPKVGADLSEGSEVIQKAGAIGRGIFNLVPALEGDGQDPSAADQARRDLARANTFDHAMEGGVPGCERRDERRGGVRRDERRTAGGDQGQFERVFRRSPVTARHPDVEALKELRTRKREPASATGHIEETRPSSKQKRLGGSAKVLPRS